MRGVPLHVLREILGHRSLETTRGYLHTDTRHLTDAATAVNAFLSASGSQTGHSGVPTFAGHRRPTLERKMAPHLRYEVREPLRRDDRI